MRKLAILLLAAIASSQVLAEESNKTATAENVRHDMCYGNAVAWAYGRSDDYPTKCLLLGMTSMRALFEKGYRVTSSMFVQKMGESAGVFFIEKAD